ncbi:putative quinol monooxygenase [Bacillus sp. Marseille-P3661]|uniref:putative quinol monooxygenase n=1 Tax=Bacillus sp. Marseille-P3661 TaxID=1936234 RepID=UPI000C85981F|nr:putative quinol monooxygenase [Bacillus sp. Marseille-P3661]
MMIIHAHIQVNPEHRDEFLEEVKIVIKHSQAEEGNISYQLFEHITEPNTFVMVEEWQDQAAIDYHFGTGHYKAYKQKTGGLLLKPALVKIFETTAKN